MNLGSQERIWAAIDPDAQMAPLFVHNLCHGQYKSHPLHGKLFTQNNEPQFPNLSKLECLNETIIGFLSVFSKLAKKQ